MPNLIITGDQRIVERNNPFPVFQALSGFFYQANKYILNSGSATQITIPGENNRKAFIQNLGSTSGIANQEGKILLGNASLNQNMFAAGSGYYLPSGQTLTFDLYSSSNMWAISSSGTAHLVVSAIG